MEAGHADIYHECHRRLDRILLPLVLEFACGKHRQAARLLGIARQTLRERLREINLEPPDAAGSSSSSSETSE